MDFHEKFKSFNAEEIKNFEKNSGISYNQGLSVIKYIEENSSGTIVKTITEEIEHQKRSFWGTQKQTNRRVHL